MASAEGQSRPSEEAAQSEPAPSTVDDGLRIHPHVYSPSVKPSSPPDFKKPLLKRVKEGNAVDAKKARFTAEEYIAHLSKARAELLGNLETPLVSDVEAAVTQSFEAYAGLLTGLVTFNIGHKAATEAEAGAAPPQWLGASPLRDSVAFTWQDVLFNSQAVNAPDAVFELASMVMAVAVWRMRRAAFLCRDTRPGISSDQAIKAYQLLLAAAGMFQYVRETCGPLLSGKTASSDCSPEAASALASIALADAQSIITLRACAKNNQPSLIASLAADSAALYRQAAEAATTVPFARKDAKALRYAEYKAQVFQAYALCFAGLNELSQQQAGRAERLLEEATRSAKAAVPAAAAYNKAEPSTPAADHKEFDTDLNICVDSAATKVKRENAHVYYQRPPQELPALPEGKRMAKTTPFLLPPPAPLLTDFGTQDAFGSGMVVRELPADLARVAPAAPATAAAGPAVPMANGAGDPAKGEASQEATEDGASCWRWLLVIIAMPLLVLITAIGIVLWIVLLPVKIICCPIGCLIQIIADIVEYLIKAPVRGLLWASGKPWKAKDPPSHR